MARFNAVNRKDVKYGAKSAKNRNLGFLVYGDENRTDSTFALGDNLRGRVLLSPMKTPIAWIASAFLFCALAGGSCGFWEKRHDAEYGGARRSSLAGSGRGVRTTLAQIRHFLIVFNGNLMAN